MVGIMIVMGRHQRVRHDKIKNPKKNWHENLFQNRLKNKSKNMRKKISG